MSNVVYIATSIDGYIAREDGNIDWLMELPNPENSDYGFSAFLAKMDGIILGRNTFETILGFKDWPYTKELPIFVFSSRMQVLPDNLPAKVEIIKGKPKSIVDALKKKGIHNLYIDGGKTIQSFLSEDLIDELIITHIPILLGKGIPLFGSNERELKFEHVETNVFNNVLVRSKYIRKRQ